MSGVALTAASGPGSLVVDTLVVSCVHGSTTYPWRDGRPVARRLALELHSSATGCTCEQDDGPPDGDAEAPEARVAGPTEALPGELASEDLDPDGAPDDAGGDDRGAHPRWNGRLEIAKRKVRIREREGRP